MFKKTNSKPAPPVPETTASIEVTAYVLPDGTISINNKEVVLYNAYLAQNLSSYVKITVSPVSKEEKEEIICGLEKSRKELEEHDKEVEVVQGKIRKYSGSNTDAGYRNRPVNEIMKEGIDDLSSAFYPTPNAASSLFENVVVTVPEDEIDDRENAYDEATKPEDDITKGYVITNDPIKKTKQRGFRL